MNASDSGDAIVPAHGIHIYIDADACPVKQEVFRVAARHGLSVTLVTGAWMRIPTEANIALVVVEQGFDAADDWIATHIERDDIVVTGDILLASRCLEKGARAIGTTGKAFTADNIGDAVATRALLADLRGAGEVTRGPAPFDPRDRSRFLQTLEEAVHLGVRARGARGAAC